MFPYFGHLLPSFKVRIIPSFWRVAPIELTWHLGHVHGALFVVLFVSFFSTKYARHFMAIWCSLFHDFFS